MKPGRKPREVDSPELVKLGDLVVRARDLDHIRLYAGTTIVECWFSGRYTQTHGTRQAAERAYARLRRATRAGS